MKLIVREDYNECSRYLADRFEEVIRRKPDAFLGLATGSSPEGMYRYLCEDHRKGLIDLSAVSTINLDEYAGLSREHDQSFGYYMDRHFFSKVNIDGRNIHLINGAGDISDEISRYEELLAERPIDILVLGIGTNGHIGFNEPDSVFCARTHEVELTQETIRANSRFFESEKDVPRRAVTMGMFGIVNARKIVLIASGRAKADAIRRLLENETADPQLPCSILHLCPDAEVIVDRELYESIRS